MVSMRNKISNRVVISVMVMAVIIGGILSAWSLITYWKIDEGIHRQYYENSLTNAATRFDNMIDEISYLCDFIVNGQILELCSDNYRLKPQEAAAIKAQILQDNEIAYDSSIIERVMVLGQDENHYSVELDNETIEFDKTTLPYLSDMLMDLSVSPLFQRMDRISYFSDANYEELHTEKLAASLQFLFQELKNKLFFSSIISGYGGKGSVLIFIVLRQEYIFADIDTTCTLHLLDDMQSIISSELVDTTKKSTITKTVDNYILTITYSGQWNQSLTAWVAIFAFTVYLIIVGGCILLWSSLLNRRIAQLAQNLQINEKTENNQKIIDKRMRFFRTNLRTQIFRAIFLSLFVPLLVIIYMLNLTISQKEYKQLATNLEMRSAIAKVNFKRSMLIYLREIRRVDKTLLQKRLQSPPYPNNSSDRLLGIEFENVEDYFLMQKNGTAISCFPFRSSAYYQKAADAVKDAIQEDNREYVFLVFDEDGRDRLLCAVAVVGEAYQEIGYLVLYIDPLVFDIDQRQDDISTIVIKDGAVIYDDSLICNKLENSTSEILTSEINPLTINKVKYFQSKTTVEEGYTIYLFYPTDVALYELTELFNAMMVVMIIVCIVVLIFAKVISLPFTRFFCSISMAVSQIGSGSFQYILYENDDEIGMVVNAYNRMVDSLERLLDENVKQKAREQELLLLKTQMEMQMLQQQINPHFFFNFLSLINFEARKVNNEKIVELVDALSQMLRYSLNRQEEVKLEDEFKQVKNYLSIQKQKFGDKFTVIWNVSEEVRKYKIIKQLVQPLVENSLSHGLYEYISGGEIYISAYKRDEYLNIEVRDNGVGIDPVSLAALRENLRDKSPIVSENGHGIGLSNVYSRLQIYYKGRASMEIESAPFEGTTIVIRIPCESLRGKAPKRSGEWISAEDLTER